MGRKDPEGRKVGLLKLRVRRHQGDERWKVARRCGAKQSLKFGHTYAQTVPFISWGCHTSMPFSITFDHIRSILYKQGRGPVAGPDSNPMKRRIFRVQVYGVGISPLQRTCCCFGFLLFFDILQIAMQSGAPLLTDCGAGIKDSDPKKQPSQANKQEMLRCEARQLLCWISKFFPAF